MKENEIKLQKKISQSLNGLNGLTATTFDICQRMKIILLINYIHTSLHNNYYEDFEFTYSYT